MTQTTNQQQNCAEKVQSILSNRKIVEVRYLTDQEQNILGCVFPTVLNIDGTIFSSGLNMLNSSPCFQIFILT